MYCPNCGKVVSDDARFCVYCGGRIDRGPEEYEAETMLLYEEPQDITAAADVPVQVGDMPVYEEPPVQDPGTPGKAAPVKADDTKWPVSIGIMGIFYFIFTVADILFLHLSYNGSFSIFSFITPFIACMVPVVYFVHTKKLAYLTSIPMTLLLIYEIIEVFLSRFIWDVPTFLIYTVIPIFISLILVILYIIQMFVRPHSPALSIIYLILSIIVRMLMAAELLVMLLQILRGDVELAFFIERLFYFVASIFATIAYTMAMFKTRKPA